MAKTYQYCVAENWGKGFIDHEESSTTALAFGGTPPNTGKTEDWNGASWSEVADLNVARNVLGGVGAGTSSSLAFGGTPPVGGQTEEWSGSSISTNILTD